MTVTTVHDGFQTRKSPIAMSSRAFNKLAVFVITVDELQLLQDGVMLAEITEALEWNFFFLENQWKEKKLNLV